MAYSTAKSRVGLLVVGVVGFGCSDDGPPGTTFYDREIQPILTQSCSGNVSGCHRVDETDPLKFAAGNLDLTSFENVSKRRDLLRPFGPYPVPLMLVKAVGRNGDLKVNYRGTELPLEIPHAGGNLIEVGSEAYQILLGWMENGATESGLPPIEEPESGAGNCSTTLPSGFDPAPYSGHAEFGSFKDTVQPVLNSCNSGNCHGAPQADFYIACGTDDEQVAFNFSQVWAFVDSPVEQSQVLQVPLAVSAGGFFHSGGDHFESKNSSDFKALREWAEKVGPIEFGAGDAGRKFFADNVQPLLLTRGCSFEACHSPSATNDLKLRSGSRGFFSPIALERNYDLLKREFLAFEVPDVRRGRAAAKGLVTANGGIAHRGGPVFETPGNTDRPPDCPPFDAGTASAICTVQEWVRLERGDMILRGEVSPLGEGANVPIVYVERELTHVATPLEFDTYQPNSDLLVRQATLDRNGTFTAATVGAPTSLLDNCPGAGDRTVVDVRSPDVHRDGNRVAFAMRTSAGDPLGVYVVELDGANCQRVTPAVADQAGLKIHNFDPAWAPVGDHIVFASTRGESGPTVTRQLFLPQADIWRMTADGGNLERVTFLTNSELSPQFMREGRIIMTTEKISEDFYQLAGRRINWDLTDYHPLLGQRAQSTFGEATDHTAVRDSIGYAQVTEIREGFDGNFSDRSLGCRSPRGRGHAGDL